MRCIIVDDEPLALSIMSSYCEEMGYLEVVGAFTNPLEATELLMEQKVDLVFSDIEMPQISGLEFIKTLDSKPLFIFTTAYQKYALDGFDLNAVDYLVKPIPFERFVKAVNRAKEIHTLKRASMIIGNTTSAGGDQLVNDYLFIKSEYGKIKLAFNEIKYIEGLKDYLKIHVNDNPNKPVLTLMSFREMEIKLPSSQFIRVHRSFMVNVNFINSVQRSKVVIGDVRIPISESYKADFFKQVGL